MLHLISYDLKKPGQDYSALYQMISSLGEPNYCLASTLLLYSRHTAGYIDQQLKSVIDGNDELMVVDITGVQEDKYFGHLTNRVNRLTVWAWMKAHND